MWTILAALTRSTIGRWFAVMLATIAMIAIIVWRIFVAGGASERAKRTEQNLKNLKTRIKTDEKVRDLPVDDVRDRLRADWLRDNKTKR
jgi:hypothetical protein